MRLSAWRRPISIVGHALLNSSLGHTGRNDIDLTLRKVRPEVIDAQVDNVTSDISPG